MLFSLNRFVVQQVESKEKKTKKLEKAQNKAKSHPFYKVVLTISNIR